MQNETQDGAVEVLPPQAGPIDKAIGIVEDAAVALGFVKRIVEAGRSIFGSADPVGDLMEDAGARAGRARIAADAARRGRGGG